MISSLLLSTALWAAAPVVKVRIGKSLSEVMVSGTDIHQQLPIKKQNNVYAGRRQVKFNCKPRQVRLIPTDRPVLLASLSSSTGLLKWGDKGYAGNFELITDSSSNRCDLINIVPMEAYISGLLAKEMHPDWPIEALKAQAVAARTYALDKAQGASDGAFHLESSERDQVYGSFFDTTANTDKAARETQGEVLVTSSGRMVPAYYHSKCGGHTLRPDQVWNSTVEGYQGVECPFCHSHGLKPWDKRIAKTQLGSYLSSALERFAGIPRVQASELLVMNGVNKNSDVKFYRGDRLHTIKKSRVRDVAGRTHFPSNNFIMVDEGNFVHVKGKGYGHGVGLCQLGALELAQRGYGYREILKFYFPNFSLKKIY